VRVEHVGRFDDVVVDADEDEIFEVHGIPRVDDRKLDNIVRLTHDSM
jgi:hypothetical protein